jgi:membrane-bound serine protease (ClpP class)
MVIGSAYLFAGGKWWIPGVNPILAVVASILYTIFLWIVVRKALQAYHRKPLHDLDELVGKVGEARTPIHGEGSVQIESELWSARSAEPILKGKRVRVVGREGFVLLVDKES